MPSPFISSQLYPKPTLEYLLNAVDILKEWIADSDFVKVELEGSLSKYSLTQVSIKYLHSCKILNDPLSVM